MKRMLALAAMMALASPAAAQLVALPPVVVPYVPVPVVRHYVPVRALSGQPLRIERYYYDVPYASELHRSGVPVASTEQNRAVAGTVIIREYYYPAASGAGRVPGRLDRPESTAVPEGRRRTLQMPTVKEALRSTTPPNSERSTKSRPDSLSAPEKKKIQTQSRPGDKIEKSNR